MKVGETLKVKDLDIAKNPAIDLHTSPEATVATVLEVHAAAADETLTVRPQKHNSNPNMGIGAEKPIYRT